MCMTGLTFWSQPRNLIVMNSLIVNLNDDFLLYNVIFIGSWSCTCSGTCSAGTTFFFNFHLCTNTKKQITVTLLFLTLNDTD